MQSMANSIDATKSYYFKNFVIFIIYIDIRLINRKSNCLFCLFLVVFMDKLILMYLLLSMK